MARLVIGTSKAATAAGLVRDISPQVYIEKAVVSDTLVSTDNIINLKGVAATLGPYMLYYAYGKPDGVTLPSFNNIDIDWSGVMGCSTQCLYYTFYGRTGINSFKFGAPGGIFSQCMYMFRYSDIKKCEILSSTLGANSSCTFLDCISLTEAKFPNVTAVTGVSAGEYMFDRCSNLTLLEMPNIETIEGTSTGAAMKQFCENTKISSVSMPKLTSISRGDRNYGSCKGMFSGCVLLTQVDIRSLETLASPYSYLTNGAGICSQMFSGCTALPTISFQSLNSVAPNSLRAAFQGCTSLQSVWFYALNSSSFPNGTQNVFMDMLYNCTDVTVHFPLAVQSAIESLSQVTGGFGGTNTTVLFDLVTSLTGADTNTYTRSEKNSTSTATAWAYNDTLYYTSGVSNHTAGVNEPTVGNTIYSDAACTTSVTTVTAIA